jgi:hypothetical protein
MPCCGALWLNFPSPTCRGHAGLPTLPTVAAPSCRPPSHATLAAAGILSPKLTQAYFGELRGAQALDSIAPDEMLVTVPKAAALVVAPSERCPCPDFVDAGGCCCWRPRLPVMAGA